MENKKLETTPDEKSSYRVVIYKASDLPLIYKPLIFSNFLLSLRSGNPLFKRADKDIYFKYYHLFIESLLARPQSEVRLAILEQDPDLVFGWALTEPDTLHYIYVPKAYRQNGIARQLLKDHEFDTITHVTDMNLFRDKNYNPWKVT